MLVVITGGGTGGHVYAATALADHLLGAGAGYRVLMMGSEAGPEREASRSLGLEFEGLRLSGMAGKSPTDRVKAAWLFARGVANCRKRLSALNPLCVIGTGGYASAPACFAAALGGVPLILHEMNTIPGMVTRYLGSKAYAVAAAFEVTRSYLDRKARFVVTGIPVRSSIADIADDAYRALAKREGREAFDLTLPGGTLLVFGGSQGARAINEATVDAVASGLVKEGTELIHVTGRGSYDAEAAQGVALLARKRGVSYRAVPYCGRMEIAYAVSDLAVTRAGAGTLAELAAAGVPSVLVPFPHSAGRHQEINARAVADTGAAKVVEQVGDSAAEALSVAVRLLGDEDELRRMTASAEGLTLGEGSKGIAALVEEVTYERAGVGGRNVT